MTNEGHVFKFLPGLVVTQNVLVHPRSSVGTFQAPSKEVVTEAT